MVSRIALIIPALDEEESIGATLDSVAGFGASPVIVVDNGSNDRTAEVARAHGAQVIKERRRGYGHACLAGIATLPPETQIVIFLDADGSDDPADLASLCEPLLRGEADLAIGSRLRGEVEPGAMTVIQRLGNRLAVLLMRVLFDARYTDLGPFRAIQRDALEKLSMQDTNFGWTIEMQIKARQRGLRTVDIPVHYRKRRGGHSKVSGTVRGSFLAGIKILWTVLRYRFSL